MFCPLEFHIIYFLTNTLCDLGQLICFLFFFNPPDFPFTFTQNEVNICFSYKILWHYNTLIEVKITTGFFVDTLSLVSYLTLPYPYTDHASGSVKNRIMWKVKWCFKRWLMSVTYVMRKRIKKIPKERTTASTLKRIIITCIESIFLSRNHHVKFNFLRTRSLWSL